MRLFEHPDFRDAISAAETHFNELPAQFIEKDYYVTEVLRTISAGWGESIIFKGGTSLSKAWNLIKRFSEDVDLALNRNSTDPALSVSQIDKKLRSIQDKVSNDHGLRFLLASEDRRSLSKRGVSRNCVFAYEPLLPMDGSIQPRVLLEMGIRSVFEPVEEREISSLLSQFLVATGQTLDAEDEGSFTIKVLHYRQTFVEKLFAIHSKFMSARKEGQSIETYARHYYDIFMLLQQSDVQKMLSENEYISMKQRAKTLSETHFKGSVFPEGLSFSNSEALFPQDEDRVMVEKAYNEQCKNLCYGKYPKWSEVADCFKQYRDFL
jgi:Nucleotidyl transferase AbiEii toxin, Type IV TA system